MIIGKCSSNFLKLRSLLVYMKLIHNILAKNFKHFFKWKQNPILNFSKSEVFCLKNLIINISKVLSHPLPIFQPTVLFVIYPTNKYSSRFVLAQIAFFHKKYYSQEILKNQNDGPHPPPITQNINKSPGVIV